ncbi:MAG: hypothetical protein ACI9CA_000657 [Natronomonas sp.]|jgi:hypothetical protein
MSDPGESATDLDPTTRCRAVREDDTRVRRPGDSDAGWVRVVWSRETVSEQDGCTTSQMAQSTEQVGGVESRQYVAYCTLFQGLLWSAKVN